VFRSRSDATLALSLVFAVFLWGGTNAGTRVVVTAWPPIWTGGTRFLCAGLLMITLLRWTSLLGPRTPLTPSTERQLWLRGGLSLAIYIICFNWAIRLTSASHVALYLGAAPVWAVLWERRPGWNFETLHRYGAAFLALAGVIVLFWPSLHGTEADWRGEALGIASSVLWTNYGRQCRVLGSALPAMETTAHTMWRAGLILLIIGMAEVAGPADIDWRADLVAIHVYCIVAGGVAAFGIWNYALRRWPTSKVLLFNNLIPLSTMLWAHYTLDEPMTATFWAAMVLVVAGVLLGQARWQQLMPGSAVPPE